MVKVSKRKIYGDDTMLDKNGMPFNLKNSRDQVEENKLYQQTLNLKTDKETYH